MVHKGNAILDIELKIMPAGYCIIRGQNQMHFRILLTIRHVHDINVQKKYALQRHITKQPLYYRDPSHFLIH
jgi:hypothetical protein